MEDKLKEFTREELAKYNGKEGQPVYIACLLYTSPSPRDKF